MCCVITSPEPQYRAVEEEGIYCVLGPVKALCVLAQFLFLPQLEGLILCSPFYRRTHIG